MTADYTTDPNFHSSLGPSDKFSSNEIKSAIKQLKPVGPDVSSIKPEFLRLLNDTCTDLIATFFNECLSHSFLPKQLSYSRLKPLLKHGKTAVTDPKIID